MSPDRITHQTALQLLGGILLFCTVPVLGAGCDKFSLSGLAKRRGSMKRNQRWSR